LAAAPPAASRSETAGAELKPLTSAQLVELFLTTPLPNVGPAVAVTNYSDPDADARVAGLAEARGYRLRGSPVLPTLEWYGGVPLQPPAIRDLQRLGAALADEVGVGLTLTYGYRSTDYQRQIFTGNVGASGSAVAAGAADGALLTTMNRIAPAGYSKHHTGYTVDLRLGGVGGYGLIYTAAYAWLAADGFANAKRFGWLPSYPPGVPNIGPNPEPWEWVWVGEAAIGCAEAPVCVDAGVERLDQRRGRIRAEGWAVAEASGARVKVRLVVDGAPGRAVRPRLARPDVASALGVLDPRVGFSLEAVVGSGRHWACVETRASGVRWWERQQCAVIEPGAS
jgi:hypothetical protein